MTTNRDANNQAARAPEPPDAGELESWRATADELLRGRSPSPWTLRKAAHLLQNAYLFASALPTSPHEAETPAAAEPLPQPAYRHLIDAEPPRHCDLWSETQVRTAISAALASHRAAPVEAPLTESIRAQQDAPDSDEPVTVSVRASEWRALSPEAQAALTQLAKGAVTKIREQNLRRARAAEDLRNVPLGAAPVEAETPSREALPRLPSSVIQCITAYGDERADDSPTAARHLGAAISEIRSWGASLLATPAETPSRVPAEPREGEKP